MLERVKAICLPQTAPVEGVGVNMQPGASFRSNVFSYDPLRHLSVYGRYPVSVAERVCTMFAPRYIDR